MLFNSLEYNAISGLHIAERIKSLSKTLVLKSAYFKAFLMHFKISMTRGRRVQFKIGKMENSGLSYEIQYTKAAEKFFKVHEDVRNQYELAIRELLSGDHPEKVDVKRI